MSAAEHTGHGSLRGYIAGFLLSVLLTAIPFWMVLGHVLPNANQTALIIMALAAVQVIVHVFFFLHLDVKSEGGWTVLALIFTLTLVGIMLSGSLWVMYHLNSNMMPMPVHDMQNMP